MSWETISPHINPLDYYYAQMPHTGSRLLRGKKHIFYPDYTPVSIEQLFTPIRASLLSINQLLAKITGFQLSEELEKAIGLQNDFYHWYLGFHPGAVDVVSYAVFENSPPNIQQALATITLTRTPENLEGPLTNTNLVATGLAGDYSRLVSAAYTFPNGRLNQLSVAIAPSEEPTGGMIWEQPILQIVGLNKDNDVVPTPAMKDKARFADSALQFTKQNDDERITEFRVGPYAVTEDSEFVTLGYEPIGLGWRFVVPAHLQKINPRLHNISPGFSSN